MFFVRQIPLYTRVTSGNYPEQVLLGLNLIIRFGWQARYFVPPSPAGRQYEPVRYTPLGTTSPRQAEAWSTSCARYGRRDTDEAARACKRTTGMQKKTIYNNSLAQTGEKHDDKECLPYTAEYVRKPFRPAVGPMTLLRLRGWPCQLCLPRPFLVPRENGLLGTSKQKLVTKRLSV